MIAPRLVAITPGHHRVAATLMPWVAALGAAGIPALLVREPDLHDAERDELIAFARAHVAVVIVHVRVPGAHGLHAPLHLTATAPTPTGVPWGRSCHSGAEVSAALGAGASWVFLSPVWGPTSKPDDDRAPLGLDRYLAVATDRPVLALGGVDASRYRRIRRRGGWGAAVCGFLFGAPAPTEAGARARALLQNG